MSEVEKWRKEISENYYSETSHFIRGYLEACKKRNEEAEAIKSDLADLDKTFLDTQKELRKCLDYVRELEKELENSRLEVKNAKLQSWKKPLDENKELKAELAEAYELLERSNLKLDMALSGKLIRLESD